MINILKNIWNRLDFSTNMLTFAELLLVLAIYPLVQYTDAKWFAEDSIVENLQMIICFACLVVAWRAPKDRPLFIFWGLLMMLMIIREINMGRHWLCAAYTSLIYCGWSDVPYGEVLHWTRNILTVFVVVYFFWRKVYRLVWQYVKTAPIYVWEFLFLALGALLAQLAESPLDNESLEELAESLFYLAFLNCLVRYEKLDK
jgi:hypothetical protein